MDIKQACYILSEIHTRESDHEFLEFVISSGASPEYPASSGGFTPEEYYEAWKTVREHYKQPSEIEMHAVPHMIPAGPPICGKCGAYSMPPWKECAVCAGTASSVILDAPSLSARLPGDE